MAREAPTEEYFLGDAVRAPRPARPAPRRGRLPATPPRRPARRDAGAPQPPRSPRPSRPPARRPARPRRTTQPGPLLAQRFWRPGAIGAVIMALSLAVIVAFVATVVYARVDADRPLETAERRSTATPVVTAALPADDRTRARPPENLSPEELAAKLKASVRTVSTRNESGEPLTGTAFVVGSFGGQTLLLTSFAVVRANTRSPGPGITLDGRQATLWTWQEDRDLALLVIGGSIESLPWAAVPPKPGEKVWAGAAGDEPAVGVVDSVSDIGIDHNIYVEGARQGAPLVNQKGEVLGVTSAVYNPAGTGTDTRYTAIPIRVACERVLRCAGGNTTPDGSTTTTTTTP